MEESYQTAGKTSEEVALRFGYRDGNCLTFAELKGAKDDVIDVLITGLAVFAFGVLILALLKG